MLDQVPFLQARKADGGTISATNGRNLCGLSITSGEASRVRPEAQATPPLQQSGSRDQAFGGQR